MEKGCRIDRSTGDENIPGVVLIWSERYRLVSRDEGVRTGKEAGERLMDAGIGEDAAVKRVLDLIDRSVHK